MVTLLAPSTSTHNDPEFLRFEPVSEPSAALALSKILAKPLMVLF